MTSPRHLSLFLTLGLFWGVSPSLYQHWGMLGMPVSHVIVMTVFDAVFPRSVLPASPPPPTLHKSSIPTGVQLLAYFTYWQDIACRDDVPNAGLCLDICYNATVLELARAAKNGKK